MTTYLYAGLGLLIVLVNIVVTIAVVRSTAYERPQKLFQLVLIWLLPFVGAALSWYVLREETRSEIRNIAEGNIYIDDTDQVGTHDHSGHHGGGDGGH